MKNPELNNKTDNLICVGQGPEQTFLQGRHMNAQQEQASANQNHNDHRL